MVVSISACLAEDPGSIPGGGVLKCSPWGLHSRCPPSEVTYNAKTSQVAVLAALHDKWHTKNFLKPDDLVSGLEKIVCSAGILR